MSKRILQPLLLLTGLFLMWSSCELIDKPEQIPSFIHIDSIQLIDNPLVEEGTLSNNIVDAWIFIDDKLIGAFELPCTVPVLLEGNQKVQVYAGIYLNGVKTTRVYYPFFTVWEKDITLVPDSIVHLKPVVTYDTNIKLPMHESFELGGVVLEEDLKSQTNLTKTSVIEEVFEGNAAGKVVLNDTDSVWMGVSIQAFQLPTAGGNVFLEMNYKSEAPIVVGVYAIKTAQILSLEVAGALPKSTWGKIYFNLTPVVFRHNDALEFKIFLGSYLPTDSSEATVLIDNIKLIHF
ncbi:MAG TPA: hypothetical protein P5228_07535 [Bacteroidales bacterium]|nr:hypothetical protein [Bacteroidales bacterium]HRZ50193.1 hypothetical protein [Bacteroidales bacterium]